ncbi:branched-chain amino acid ABC transporter permease [Variovorax sp. J31P207]|uniref:branched-chain amino acid ABC transporter permease n=1 Tax=Variovorax sp. J31P207 TaxID=3053510 RepID=UPI002574BF8F|nr:branched-chain amino acid ABC transporter permease [Variovorax sp. J31P207]MDM0069958.1 branched-chain amino acid ABC transporter permease [Variovorax sp. J31P207]
MSSVLQALFEILSFASIVVLVVLGLGVIASMMGIFNFAQGEFVLLGAYTAYLCYSHGLPLWSGILAAPVVVGLIGLVLERLVIRRLYSAPIVAMLATYALGLVIRESVRALTGGLYIAVPEPIEGSVDIAGIGLSAWRLVVVIVTISVIAACHLLLTRTSFGLRVRASLENAPLARASGISTSFIYAVTFAFGAALAGLAGAMIVPLFSLFADLGLRFLIQGFVAVMVGGAGSFAGPVLGGGVIGLLSALLPWAISPAFADVLVFAIAIVFVKFRPKGLLSFKGAKS